MIDALSPDQTETQLLRGFQKLGLDPSMVKIIVVGHGHADHFGDSAYFRSRLETYGTAHARGGRGGPAVPLLKHDQLLVEGPRGKSA